MQELILLLKSGVIREVYSLGCTHNLFKYVKYAHVFLKLYFKIFPVFVGFGVSSCWMLNFLFILDVYVLCFLVQFVV